MLLYGKFLRMKDSVNLLSRKNIAMTDSSEIKIEINLKKYSLTLMDGNIPIKKYRVFLGHSKSKMGSLRNGFVTTPVGKYKVTSVDTNKQFYIRIGINYPNLEDVKTAYKNRFITEKKFRSLWKAINNQKKVNFDKKIFGPEISIEGYGKLNYILKNLPFVFNWTNGSIALSNEDINELIRFVKPGTEVKIVE